MKLPILALGLLFTSFNNAADLLGHEEADGAPIAFEESATALFTPEFEAASAEDVSEIEAVMPSTLNTIGEDDSGNWVLKRVWWEKAESVFGEVVRYNAQASSQQIEYFTARNEIDKQLDQERRNLPLTAAEMAKVLEHLLGMVNAGDNQAEVDAVTNNSFRGTVLANQAKLAELQTELKALTQLDRDLDNVIIKVIEQVRKCNDYESRAWEDFKQIGRVLNDETAKALYYQVSNYADNIKLVLAYLQNDLKNAFKMVVERIKGKVGKLGQLIDELHDGGLDLVYESKVLDGKIDTRAKDLQPKPAAPEKKSKASTPGWWGVVVNSLQGLWDILLWLPRKLFGLFGIKF